MKWNRGGLGVGTIDDQQAVVDAINEREDWTHQLNVRGDSYDFLESVWRNPRAPYPVRKRAAEQCLAYDRPKLAVTAHIAEEGFAERLERALARSHNAGLIDHRGKSE